MQTEKIDITPAKMADIPNMVLLLASLFGIEQDFSANTDKQIAGLTQLLSSDKGCIMVARNTEQQVIGMVTAQLVISTSEGGFSAWVEDMVIDANYRQLGIGKRLLQSILDWARAHGATRAQLLVDLDNEPALVYYQHLGWASSRMGMRRLRLKKDYC